MTVTQCPACSAELEVGWKFCPTCGRRAETLQADESFGDAAVEETQTP
jgi:uncharacterized Zn finger protein (UPF0148 family)